MPHLHKALTLAETFMKPLIITTILMKSLIIITIILTLYSCTKQDIPTRPYLSFDNTAKEWFSDLKINDTLKFLNNFGNTRSYRVSNIETTKKDASDCTFTTGNCTIYFDYDERVIYFDRVDSFSSPTKISISMFPPNGVDYKNLPPNFKATASIYGFFDDYNGQILANGDRILLTFPNIYQTVTFQTLVGATKTYNEVLKFNSNNSNTYYHTGWNRNYNISEVWYDRKFGFVYFKDIFGQAWVRQN